MGAVLGGLCPLPIRLGGDMETGWTASEQSRLCSDLASTNRTLPFAVLTFERGSNPGDSPVVVRHNSRASVPEVEIDGDFDGVFPNNLTLTWPDAPQNDLGEKHTLRINSFSVFVHGSTNQPTCEIAGPTQITVGPIGGSGFSGRATIKIYATWGRPARIEDYDGDPDKHDATRETTPYAWIEYQQQEAAWGSGYGTERSGSVHGRKLAIGRALAAAYRSEERLRCNSRPDTAEALLDDWARSLDVPIPFGEPAWKTRRMCSLMLRAQSGQSIPDLEVSCAELLGPSFLAIRTFDFDDEPGVWPASWDLGSGVWASSRCRILVDVRPPIFPGDAEFRGLVQVRLMRMLDRLTPSHCWFNWTIPGEGFYLDLSPLDYTGL